MGDTPRVDFDAIYRRNVAFVWRAVLRFGVPEALAKDATQEVFLLLFRKLDTIDPEKVRAWLFGAARRVAANLRRAAERGDRRVVALPQRDERETEHRLRARQALELVDGFLATLDPERRDVFWLAQIEGFKLREVAALLESNINTVGSRLRSARIAFATYVGRDDRGETLKWMS